jgi:outer membrane protein TolC
VYYNNPNSRFFPPQATFKSTWDAGLSLNWNISSLYTSKHTVEEAKATLLQSNLQESQLSDAARTDVANQFYNWQTARSKKALAVKSLQQALENQKVIRARLNQQIATPTELLDADTLQIQAEINRISADADAQLAYFKLLKSAGKL